MVPIRCAALWVRIGIPLVIVAVALAIGSGVFSGKPETSGATCRPHRGGGPLPLVHRRLGGAVTGDDRIGGAPRDRAAGGAGRSTAQIEQTLVDQYGRTILLEPPDSGGFAVIWIVPIVLAAGALGVMGVLFWRRSRLFAATTAGKRVGRTRRTGDRATTDDRRGTGRGRNAPTPSSERWSSTTSASSCCVRSTTPTASTTPATCPRRITTSFWPGTGPDWPRSRRSWPLWARSERARRPRTRAENRSPRRLPGAATGTWRRVGIVVGLPVHRGRGGDPGGPRGEPEPARAGAVGQRHPVQGTKDRGSTG